MPINGVLSLKLCPIPIHKKSTSFWHIFTLFLGRGLTTREWVAEFHQIQQIKRHQKHNGPPPRVSNAKKTRHGAEHLRLNPIKTDMDALRFLGSPWRREASRKLQLIPVLVSLEQRTHLHLQVGSRPLAPACTFAFAVPYGEDLLHCRGLPRRADDETSCIENGKRLARLPRLHINPPNRQSTARSAGNREFSCSSTTHTKLISHLAPLEASSAVVISFSWPAQIMNRFTATSLPIQSEANNDAF